MPSHRLHLKHRFMTQNQAIACLTLLRRPAFSRCNFLKITSISSSVYYFAITSPCVETCDGPPFGLELHHHSFPDLYLGKMLIPSRALRPARDGQGRALRPALWTKSTSHLWSLHVASVSQHIVSGLQHCSFLALRAWRAAAPSVQPSRLQATASVVGMPAQPFCSCAPPGACVTICRCQAARGLGV